MTTLPIAAVQASYVRMDREATIGKVAALTAAASARGAQLIVFPGRNRLIPAVYLDDNGPWLEEGNTGLDRDGELITYCTIGGRASTAWFVLTCLLGRDRVRVYDGSWAEWGKMAGTPVEQSAS